MSQWKSIFVKNKTWTLYFYEDELNKPYSVTLIAHYLAIYSS